MRAPFLILVDNWTRASNRGPHASREPAPLYKRTADPHTAQFEIRNAIQRGSIAMELEPNKQGDAALSNPTADLGARLDAMRLGDPSSSPPLSPQLVLVPSAAPVMRTPPQMPQSPPRVLVPTAANVARPLLL